MNKRGRSIKVSRFCVYMDSVLRRLQTKIMVRDADRSGKQFRSKKVGIGCELVEVIGVSVNVMKIALEIGMALRNTFVVEFCGSGGIIGACGNCRGRFLCDIHVGCRACLSMLLSSSVCGMAIGRSVGGARLSHARQVVIQPMFGCISYLSCGLRLWFMRSKVLTLYHDFREGLREVFLFCGKLRGGFERDEAIAAGDIAIRGSNDGGFAAVGFFTDADIQRNVA